MLVLASQKSPSAAHDTYIFFPGGEFRALPYQYKYSVCTGFPRPLWHNQVDTKPGFLSFVYFASRMYAGKFYVKTL